MNSNLCACLFCILFAINYIVAQTPVKNYDKETFNTIEPELLHNKKIPKEIEAQVATALSFYPELKDIKITFKFRNVATPLTARPRIRGLFRKKKNRPYIITISTRSDSKFSPIMFSNLPYNAQIGVLGHELGHIFYYNTKNSWQLLSLSTKLLKKRFVDQFEFRTDRICIEHGLGYQLLDWSKFVRNTLEIDEWKGITTPDSSQEESKNQRYMNPQTIKKYINSNSIYTKLE